MVFFMPLEFVSANSKLYLIFFIYHMKKRKVFNNKLNILCLYFTPITISKLYDSYK